MALESKFVVADMRFLFEIFVLVSIRPAFSAHAQLASIHAYATETTRQRLSEGNFPIINDFSGPSSSPSPTNVVGTSDRLI